LVPSSRGCLVISNQPNTPFKPLILELRMQLTKHSHLITRDIRMRIVIGTLLMVDKNYAQ
jgi:hypothetical protein